MKNVAFFTVGEISKRLGVPTHRVAYVVRSRGIAPTRRAGILRLFDDAAFRTIARECEAVTRRNETARPCEE